MPFGDSKKLNVIIGENMYFVDVERNLWKIEGKLQEYVITFEFDVTMIFAFETNYIVLQSTNNILYLFELDTKILTFTSWDFDI